MRLIAALLAAEVPPGIAPQAIGVVVVRAVFPAIILMRRPGLDQRAVDAEVFVADQSRFLRLWTE